MQEFDLYYRQICAAAAALKFPLVAWVANLLIGVGGTLFVDPMC